MNHNWEKKTLGECAKVYMEQISYVHYNYTNKKEREMEIKRLIEHYISIVHDVKKLNKEKKK